MGDPRGYRRQPVPMHGLRQDRGSDQSRGGIRCPDGRRREMKAFEYFEPATLNEAVALLSEHGPEARVMAGGTDLLVQMKYRLRTPRYLINIKPLSELEHITAETHQIRIGALTKLADVERSPVVRERFPVLAEAIHTIGSRPGRNRGTGGGNLCHASPSADAAPPLLTLGATAVIQGPQGRRTMLLDQ